MLLVILILSIVCVANGRVLLFLPLTTAMLHAALKATLEGRTRGPAIMAAITMRQSTKVWTDVTVAVGEHISTLATLEAVIPLSFVLVAVLPLVNSIAVHLVVLPLA